MSRGFVKRGRIFRVIDNRRPADDDDDDDGPPPLTYTGRPRYQQPPPPYHYQHRVRGGGVQGSHYRGRGGPANQNRNLLTQAERMKYIPPRVSGGDGGGSGGRELWTKINVLKGVDVCPSNVLIEQLGAAVGIQLRVYNYRNEGQNIIFFIKLRQSQRDEFKRAADNVSVDGGLTKLNIIMLPVNEPSITTNLPEQWVESVRTCLSGRYQATSRTMDLSSLHTDPLLLSQGLYLPLNKGVIIALVARVVKENVNELNKLTLSGNHLINLTPFEAFAESIPILAIDLSDNQIARCSDLRPLAKIKNLVELNLVDTPLVGRIKDFTLFGKEVRTIFHGLLRLNGRDLPPPVQFAITIRPQRPLPPSQKWYFPMESLKEPLVQFVKEYFSKYDSTTRRGDSLLSFYGPGSVLTFACANNHVGPSMQPLHSSYLQASRNLIRVRDRNRQAVLVAKGAVGIAAALNKLPRTEHVLDSFSLDVISSSGNLILFNLSGVFNEIQETSAKSERSRVLRCFARTMILVPPNVVVHDDLLITNPTPTICKAHMNTTGPNKSSSNGAAVSTSSHQGIPPAMPTPMSIVLPNANSEEARRDAMVAEFRQHSGMNASFSRQCLEESGWDMNVAGVTFMTLRQANKIPQVAFN